MLFVALKFENVKATTMGGDFGVNGCVGLFLVKYGAAPDITDTVCMSMHDSGDQGEIDREHGCKVPRVDHQDCDMSLL